MEYTQQNTRLPKTPQERQDWKRVIIILEHCPIASVSTDKGFELLSEKHRNTHAKRNQDPAEWRPDVVHQCLLHLMDSPLNRAGKLQVFLRTKGGVCIAVDPRLRVPRNMKLFEKMMVMCIYKMKVRSTTGYLSLLKIVKNPITDHIPANAQLIRVEKDGDLVDMYEYAKTLGHMPGSENAPKADGEAATAEAKEEAVGEKRARDDAEEVSRKTAEAEEDNSDAEEDLIDGEDEESDDEEEDEDEDEDDEYAEVSGYRSAQSDANELYEGVRTKALASTTFAPFAFIIGGMSKGDVNVDYAEPGKVGSIRLGNRGMSAAAVCSVILHSFEEAWLDKPDAAQQL